MPAPPARWSAPGLATFVGRRRELEAVETAWTGVQQGAREVLFLCGEAGAGKSRLATEAANALHRRGASVLVGGCRAELGTPYDPLAEPLRALLPWAASGRLRLDDDAATHHEVLERLRAMTGPTGASTASAPPTSLVVDAMGRLLEAAARPRPLVLVLDDLHWADESGLRLLRHLVERLLEVPLLVLATMRTGAAQMSPDRAATISPMYRLEGVSRLDLPGLDTGEIAQYLRGTYGLGVEDARAVAPLLRDRTGGNPFLVREVCRDADLRGGLGLLAAGTSARMPDTVRDSVLHGWAALPPDHLDAVRMAAVLGEDFAVSELAAVVQGARDPGAPDGSDSRRPLSETLEKVGSAVAVGLLERVPARDGRYRFSHSLARQAVLQTLTEGDLARSHERVALSLEAAEADRPDRARRLAHHFAGAISLGYREEASRYLADAAEDADRRLAYADAALLYERAAAAAPSSGRRDDLRLAGAACHSRAGHLRACRALSRDVAADGATTGHRLRAAVAHEAAAWRSGEPGQASVDLLRRAMAADAEAPDADVEPSVRVLATAALGHAYAYSGAFAEGRTLTGRALCAARSSGDPHLLADVLELATTGDPGLARLDEALALAEELGVVAAGLGDQARTAQSACVRCYGYYVRGRPDRLAEASAVAAAAAPSDRQPYFTWTEATVRYGLLMMAADLHGAAQAAAAARAMAEHFDDPDAVAGSWGLQGFLVRRELGRLESTRPLVLSGVDPAATWAPGLLALATELGLPSQVGPLVDWVLTHDLPARRSSTTWPAVLSLLVDAVTLLEHRARAEELLGWAREYSGCNLLGGEFIAPMGSADRAVAQLESVLGLAQADASFAAALEMDTRMEAPLHRATTLAEQVRHLRRTGRPSEAAPVARSARALADRHGLARVHRLLGPRADDGVGPVAATGQGDHPAVVLTAREDEVLDLVARGLSNRQIARALVISEYTAANHVRNIMSKTGAANRTQAVHHASARRAAGR